MSSRAFSLVLAFLLVSCGAPEGPLDRDVEVRVEGIGIDRASEMPVVVLEERLGGRQLPIWIGAAEARSIAFEMDQVELPRPNTHDLAERLLTRLEAKLERVVVTELRQGTYFAVLVVMTPGRRLEIDARPSDAISIALRAEAPIYVRETLLADEDPFSIDGEDGRVSL